MRGTEVGALCYLFLALLGTYCSVLADENGGWMDGLVVWRRSYNIPLAHLMALRDLLSLVFLHEVISALVIKTHI